MLSLVSSAGMTLNNYAVLWIGTLTEGPVQRESPPVLVKESHIDYSRTSVCGRTYLGAVDRKDGKKSLPTLSNVFWSANIHILFYLALLNMRNNLKQNGWTDLCRINPGP